MSNTEVNAKIGFETDDKPLKKLHEGIQSLKEGLLGLTATLVESGVSLYETVVKTSEAGEAAIRLGQSTGVGTEKIQELQFAAKMMGVETESLNKGLNLLNRNMFTVAKGGGGLNDIFMKTGISIKQADGRLKPANEVLGEIADKFKKMPDGPEKAGLAMQYFGRNGAALIPILNQGSKGIGAMGAEARELGAILSEKDAQAGKKFQEVLKTLFAAFTGIRNIVAGELLPAFTEMVQGIVNWVRANRKLIQSGLGGFLKATATYLIAVFKAITAVANSLAGFIDIMGGAENATKLFLFTIGILSGASILFGIGKLIQSVYAFATAFTVADAAALLIPIAIGLAIVAIGLLIEDIYTFFSGGDSLIGRFFGKFPEIANSIRRLFMPVLEPILAIVYEIFNGFDSWGDLFKNIGALLFNALMLPIRALYETLGSLTGLLSKIPGLSALSGASDYFKSASGGLKLDTTIPGSTPSAANANSNSSVAINAPITVNVPEGTPPGLVGDRVSQGVSQGVETHLRSAQRATGTAVAY